MMTVRLDSGHVMTVDNARALVMIEHGAVQVDPSEVETAEAVVEVETAERPAKRSPRKRPTSKG